MAEKTKAVMDPQGCLAAFRCATGIVEITERFPWWNGGHERIKYDGLPGLFARILRNHGGSAGTDRCSSLPDSMTEAAGVRAWLASCQAGGCVDQSVIDRMPDEHEGIIGMLKMIECRADEFRSA